MFVHLLCVDTLTEWLFFPMLNIMEGKKVLGNQLQTMNYLAYTSLIETISYNMWTD